MASTSASTTPAAGASPSPDLSCYWIKRSCNKDKRQLPLGSKIDIDEIVSHVVHNHAVYLDLSGQEMGYDKAKELAIKLRNHKTFLVYLNLFENGISTDQSSKIYTILFGPRQTFHIKESDKHGKSKSSKVALDSAPNQSLCYIRTGKKLCNLPGHLENRTLMFAYHRIVF